jgi:hypothetical protein
MSAVPGPVYGLEVPPGEILIPATMEFPASVSSSPARRILLDAMQCATLRWLVLSWRRIICDSSSVWS